MLIFIVQYNFVYLFCSKIFLMKKAISVIILFTVIAGCNKEYVEPRSGIFRGVFEMTVLNGEGFETGGCTISLNDQSNQFLFNSDTTSDFPYSCSGLYSLIDATHIRFDKQYGIDPSLVADNHLYLDTIYTYKFDDTRFEITKEVNTILYEYKFIRY